MIIIYSMLILTKEFIFFNDVNQINHSHEHMNTMVLGGSLKIIFRSYQHHQLSVRQKYFILKNIWVTENISARCLSLLCPRVTVHNAEYADCDGEYEESAVRVQWAPERTVYKHLQKDRYNEIWLFEIICLLSRLLWSCILVLNSSIASWIINISLTTNKFEHNGSFQLNLLENALWDFYLLCCHQNKYLLYFQIHILECRRAGLVNWEKWIFRRWSTLAQE